MGRCPCSPTASGGTGPYTYDWSILTPGGASLDSETIPNPSFSSPDGGEFTCQVIVSDANGFLATDQVLVSVCAAMIDLSSGVVTGLVEHRACTSITAGGTFGVGPTGDLRLEAPLVVL